jgi:hypothetical protein
MAERRKAPAWAPSDGLQQTTCSNVVRGWKVRERVIVIEQIIRIVTIPRPSRLESVTQSLLSTNCYQMLTTYGYHIRAYKNSRS